MWMTAQIIWFWETLMKIVYIASLYWTVFWLETSNLSAKKLLISSKTLEETCDISRVCFSGSVFFRVSQTFGHKKKVSIIAPFNLLTFWDKQWEIGGCIFLSYRVNHTSDSIKTLSLVCLLSRRNNCNITEMSLVVCLYKQGHSCN